jgi:hypothetical protein
MRRALTCTWLEMRFMADSLKTHEQRAGRNAKEGEAGDE